MENNLKKFENDVFGDLNTVVINEEIWLNANDVCRGLGYSNPWDALARHVDGDDLVKHEAWVVTGTKADGTDAKRKTQVNYVNESGFYSLVFGSKLPGAKDFKKWVTSEVLPSIRKHGYYVDKKRIVELEENNKSLERKISYFQTITDDTHTITITQIACDYGISGKKLNQLLNEWGIQYKVNDQWILKADYKDKGYTKTITYSYFNVDEERCKYKMSTYWTQKGRLFIDEQMKQHGYCMV